MRRNVTAGMSKNRVIAIALVAALAGCGHAASPVASPPAATTAQVWQLRYVLLDHYQDFAFCDPDFYPVARDDEATAASDWWQHADHAGLEARAILDRLAYREPLTTEQQLTAYRAHKKLTVITMAPVAGGYRYELSISTTGIEPDRTVDGTITSGGRISETSRTPRPGGCPICLEAATRIATPLGDVPVSDIRVGDLVWTIGDSGQRVAAAVERVAHRATPGPHLMLRLVLADGRTLIAAGAHPDAQHRYLRELRAGQQYDGAKVTSIGWVVSTAPATYDLLPAGATAEYWANGVLVGSTISP